MPHQMNLNTDQLDLGPNYQQYVVDHAGMITVIGHHLKTTTTRCHIRSMSLAGALLEVPAGFEVPAHFFLEIVGIKDEIGCTLVKREDEVVLISFNMLVTEEFLHHVLRLAFEMRA